MRENKLNISNIENFFYELLYKNVSNNVFVTSAPKAINSSWKDFIVVDCDGIADWDAFGRGIVLLYIYVPSLGTTGRKNVNHFSQLEEKINNAIQNNSNPTYKISRNETYSDYDDERGMFVNILELNLMILT